MPTTSSIYGVDVRPIMKDNRLTYTQKVLMMNLLFLCNEEGWQGEERPLTIREIGKHTNISAGEICEDIAVLKHFGYIQAEKRKPRINGRLRGHEMWHIRISNTIQQPKPVPQESVPFERMGNFSMW